MRTVFVLAICFGVCAAAPCRATEPATDQFVDFASRQLPPDETAFLQRQIDAAADAGGGRVIVPAGRHGIRQLFLKSNVELHLSPSAELVSLLSPAEARIAEKADSDWFLIGGDGLSHVSITGQGRIDGNGYAFWKKRPGVDYPTDSTRGPQYGWVAGRPLGMVCFKNCRDIILRDVELSNPPTYTVWLLGCDRGLVQNVRISTDQAGPNTDGLDIDCCSDISIADCNIKAGDDAVALKSSLHHLGREKACERITVRNCRLGSRHCGIRLGWEGDNVIRDCIFSGNVMVSGIGISLLTVTAAQGNVKKGSPIRDIIFRDNIMDVGCAFQIRQGRVDGPNPPVASIDNVLIDNTIVRTAIGSYIAGIPGNPIRNLTIRHLVMTMKDAPGDDYRANRDWTPPETDSFRIPKCTELPYGLAVNCVENFRLEDYRMVTAHPERWVGDVKRFACAVSGCKPHETVLEPGRVQVVIAEDAVKNVQFAAQEMTNFLSRVLGAEVPIVEKGKESKSKVEVEERMVSVFLGEGEWTRQAGLDVAQLKEDGYFIRSVPDGVVIAGVDDADEDPFAAIRTGRGKGARHATLNGVYGFLERYAGCRFYFPGELGEIVPRKGRIAFAADVRDEPVFDFRCSSGPYANTIWFPPQGPAYHPPRQLNWYRLRTSGRGRPLVHGVRHMQLWRRFGKDHPDWFARKDTAQLCWSSAIKDEIAKDAIAYLKGEDAASRGYVREARGRYDAKGWPSGAFFPGLVCVDADDGYVQCKCAACSAAVTAWTNAHPKASSASGLMWSAWKEIGEKVKAAGAKGRLFALAYSAYQDLPDIDLCDNLFVGCARLGGWSYGAQDRYRKELGDVRAWAEKTHGKTHLHNWSLKYGSVNMPGPPSVAPKAVAQYYRDVAPYACSVLNETTSDRYAHIYLNDYMMAKTTWDPTFDAEAALAEHHRLMFGAAAPEMATLFAEMEDVWINRIMAGKLTMTPLGPQIATPNPFEIWRVIYSSERIAKWTKLFDDGAAKLGSESLELRRLKLMRSEILDVLVKTRQEFVGGIDAEAEMTRRKREGVKNLLDKEYSFEFHVPAEKPEKDHERATKQTCAVIPYVFDTNTTYRLSCFLEAEDVVRTGGGYRFNGANVALWARPGWVWPTKTGATIGSTFGRVHQSIVFKGSMCFRPEEFPKTAICHGISVWLRGATGRMKVDGLILEKVE